MLEIATFALAVFTGILAIATVILAFETRRLATLSSLSEETKFILDQNWRLFSERGNLHSAIPPANLGDEHWRWRMSILPYINLLHLAYRRETFWPTHFRHNKRLETYVQSVKEKFKVLSEDTNSRNELKRIIESEGNLSLEFVNWLRERGIYTDNTSVT